MFDDILADFMTGRAFRIFAMSATAIAVIWLISFLVCWATTLIRQRSELGPSEGEKRNMGLLAGLTGNAAEITPAEGTELFKQVLMEDEHVVRAYQLFRDAFAFTERRLILKDAQRLTGKKIEWHSVPYRSISHFAIETAGVNDWDAELKIYVSGNETPAITKKFNRKLSIYEVGNTLAGHVCPPAQEKSSNSAGEGVPENDAGAR